MFISRGLGRGGEGGYVGAEGGGAGGGGGGGGEKVKHGEKRKKVGEK